jgi:hypothetical protein
MAEKKKLKKFKKQVQLENAHNMDTAIFVKS